MVRSHSRLQSLDWKVLRMTIRVISLVMFCSLSHLFSMPLQAVSNIGDAMMTQDQALSILRSSTANSPNVGFVVVRKIEPTPSTIHEAQKSLNEARLKHLNLYGGGVLVNLIRSGGFAVLEFDEKSDTANRFHLVTLDEAGKAIVQSRDVHGNLTRKEALMIVTRSGDFSDAFFSSPSSEMKQIALDFGGAEMAALGTSDGQGYFEIPEAVRKLTTRADELLDLASLSSALQLWPIRHSLTMPVYAASPVEAVKLARDDQFKLMEKFLAEKAKHPDFIFHLLDLDSIKTRDELTARLQWLTELSSFLDNHSPLESDAATYRANVSISAMPLELGVEHNSDRFYAVMTAPGLISIWARDKSGNFVLKGVSEGE